MRPLICHPATPSVAVQDLRAALTRQPEGGVRLRYRLQADLAQLRIPSVLPSTRADRLWEHTCFEAFFTTPQGAAYYEYNFSPSSQWVAYAFTAYRHPSVWALPQAPEMTVTQTATVLQLEVYLAALPPIFAQQVWVCGLSAVIETTAGGLSYWALAHPAQRPDFHQREGWLYVIGT